MSNVFYTSDRQSDNRPSLTRAEELEHTKPSENAPLIDWLAWESNNGVSTSELMNEQEQVLLFVANTLREMNREHYLLYLRQDSTHNSIDFELPTSTGAIISATIGWNKTRYYFESITHKVKSMYGNPIPAQQVANALGAGCAPVTASKNALRQAITENRIAINNAVDDQNFGRKMLEKGKFPRVVEKFLTALQVAGFTINRTK